MTIRRFITVLALTTLAACGGGGGSSPTSTPPPTNQSVGGIWKGRFTTPSGVSVDGLALVADNGSFYSEAKNLNNGCADVATGTLTTNGSKVSGTAKFAIVSYSTVTGVQTNCVFPDGSTSGTEIISGSVVQGSTLTLTGVATTSKGTTLPSSTVTANFDNLYKESSSLGKVAGNWTGPTGDVMTVSANGALASQDPTSGCDVNGHISIINASFNAYSLSATYSNCQGNASILNEVTATGLLTLDDTVSPNVLYAGYSVTLSNGAFIIVVADDTRSSGGSVPNASPGGIWQGTDPISGLSLYGVVTESGQFNFFRSDGAQYFGTVTTSGNNLSGTFNGILAAGQVFSDGSNYGAGTISGAIQARQSISATINFTTAGGTTTTQPLNLTFNALYNSGSSLASVAGSYLDQVGNSTINVNASGVVFDQQATTGCVINGKISIINALYDAYQVQYSFSSCQGSSAYLNGTTATGLGVLDTTVSPVVAYIGVVNNAAHYVLTGQYTQEGGAGVPGVGVVPTSLTFVPQALGTTSATQPITVTNTGTAALTVSGITITGTNAASFAQTNACSSVAAGASCTINVTFAPTAMGLQSASLSIASNAPGSPTVVPLSGTGAAPVFGISPMSLAFASQRVGTTSAAQPVTVTNIGTATLIVNSVGIAGAGAASFAQTNNCTGLAVGASCTVNVTFAPAATGPQSASLNIVPNGAGGTATVALSGTGTAPAIGVSPTSLTYPSQAVGTTSAAQPVTVINTGTAALTVSSVTLTGTNATAFGQTNNCTSLAVGASCAINVTFTPTAAGLQLASINIASNAPGSPTVVALSGTGTAPTISVSPAGLTFAVQATGTTSGAQPVTVTNTGTATLTVSGITITGTNAASFAQTNTCSSVAVGASCTVNATFTPTATGLQSASLNIASNAAGSPTVVPLSGGVPFWDWVSGSTTRDASGVYGAQGVAAAGNVPGARYSSVSWIDTAGNLWLFGGLANDSTGSWGWLNDLWKYSPSTGLWTWVSGASTINAGGVYGTQGVAAAGNVPGARYSPVSWIDAGGDLWLFGGAGYDANGAGGDLNDLWEYSPSTGLWTWVSGASTVSAGGVYGTQGVAAAGNVPGARDYSISWIDASGNLWLFGGVGNDSTGSGGVLNDLWEYSPSTGLWTWVSGASTVNAGGTYGTQGVAAAGNVPGARMSPVSWIDTAGNLWLFGGNGFGSGGYSAGYLNDLWEYSPNTGLWTWVSGASAAGASGVYGTEGVAAAGNPGGRMCPVSWIDASGNLWLFGGQGYASTGSGGALNDLWEYSPSTGLWTWVSGASTINAGGVYGTQGVAAAGNVPGARDYSISWIDASGNLWLFGGVGNDSNGSFGELNDLWKITPP